MRSSLKPKAPKASRNRSLRIDPRIIMMKENRA